MLSPAAPCEGRCQAGEKTAASTVRRKLLYRMASAAARKAGDVPPRRRDEFYAVRRLAAGTLVEARDTAATRDQAEGRGPAG